jgi:pimeloyl-ACP methyl ester carboxylesterase
MQDRCGHAQTLDSSIMLNVRVLGDPAGRTVLALHGLNGHGGRLADLGARLGYRLVCPDLRGHGRSPGDPPWHLDQVVSDLVALSLPGPLDVIGYSFGGFVAVALAARRPDLVDRLALLDPSIGLAPEFVAAIAANALKVEVFDSRDAAVDHMAAIWPMLDRTDAQTEVDESLVRSADGDHRVLGDVPADAAADPADAAGPHDGQSAGDADLRRVLRGRGARTHRDAGLRAPPAAGEAGRDRRAHPGFLDGLRSDTCTHDACPNGSLLADRAGTAR